MYSFLASTSDIGNRTFIVKAEILVGGYVYARNFNVQFFIGISGCSIIEPSTYPTLFVCESYLPCMISIPTAYTYSDTLNCPMLGYLEFNLLDTTNST